MSSSESVIAGLWSPHAGASPAFAPDDLDRVCARFREPHVVIRDAQGAVGVGVDGRLDANATHGFPVLGVLPGLYPEWLGCRSFQRTHGTRFSYIAGAMANGIATEAVVIEMARAGMLGFFGAAGLEPARVERGLTAIGSALNERGSTWGSNLIHSPNEPELEDAIVDLYLRYGVRRVSASAYMGLTAALVRYAYHGIRADAHGRIERDNFVFAKISRPETAAKFMAPAPDAILDALVTQGHLTPTQAELARRCPIAEDIIVESDSGGHTDNRPLGSLFPTIAAARNAAQRQHGFARPIRVGAAGGLGTPQAVASAFALGAAFVLTGSINQAAVESGLSEEGKAMLARAGLADVIMAPAADMFELGVDVQVLRTGTMFATRARKLYALYRAYDRFDEVPDAERAKVERDILRATFDEAWASTAAFFRERNPAEITRAERDPKHKMALVFRSYLGLSSKWAIRGDESRRLDYQIWCGPAMGAFNAWTEGSFLAEPEERTVTQMACNLLEGAAQVTRAQQLRSYGVPVSDAAFAPTPQRLV